MCLFIPSALNGVVQKSQNTKGSLSNGDAFSVNFIISNINIQSSTYIN